ncbi:MAG: GPP34 family phosphoprotein [bacterium]
MEKEKDPQAERKALRKSLRSGAGSEKDNIMFNLAEDFYLLALDGEKGSLGGTISMTMQYLTAGAILIDLSARGRVRLENGQLTAAGPAIMGDPVLDRAWELLAQSKTALPPDKWVRQFTKQYKEFLALMTTRLMEKRVIKCVNKKILGIFPVKRYPLRRKRYKRELLREVRSAILRTRQPDERMMGMIRLVYISGLISQIFPRELQKKAKEKIKLLLKADNIQVDTEQMERNIAKTVERMVTAKKIQHAAMHSGG